jgi:hypothetical protein
MALKIQRNRVEPVGGARNSTPSWRQHKILSARGLLEATPFLGAIAEGRRLKRQSAATGRAGVKRAVKKRLTQPGSTKDTIVKAVRRGKTPAQKLGERSGAAFTKIDRARGRAADSRSKASPKLRPPVNPPRASKTSKKSRLPSYQHGGVVEETGPAIVHKGEVVIPTGPNVTTAGKPAGWTTNPASPPPTRGVQVSKVGPRNRRSPLQIPQRTSRRRSPSGRGNRETPDYRDLGAEDAQRYARRMMDSPAGRGDRATNPSFNPDQPATSRSRSRRSGSGNTSRVTASRLPSYQHGGVVEETGPAIVHKGEVVIPNASQERKRTDPFAPTPVRPIRKGSAPPLGQGDRERPRRTQPDLPRAPVDPATDPRNRKRRAPVPESKNQTARRTGRYPGNWQEDQQPRRTTAPRTRDLHSRITGIDEAKPKAAAANSEISIYNTGKGFEVRGAMGGDDSGKVLAKFSRARVESEVKRGGGRSTEAVVRLFRAKVPSGSKARVGTGSSPRLPSYQRVGVVKETGPAVVHKGEVVVPPEKNTQPPKIDLGDPSESWRQPQESKGYVQRFGKKPPYLGPKNTGPSRWKGGPPLEGDLIGTHTFEDGTTVKKDWKSLELTDEGFVEQDDRPRPPVRKGETKSGLMRGVPESYSVYDRALIQSHRKRLRKSDEYRDMPAKDRWKGMAGPGWPGEMGMGPAGGKGEGWFKKRPQDDLAKSGPNPARPVTSGKSRKERGLPPSTKEGRAWTRHAKQRHGAWKSDAVVDDSGLPSYQRGGVVKKTGPAIVHKGEVVIRPDPGTRRRLKRSKRAPGPASGSTPGGALQGRPLGGSLGRQPGTPGFSRQLSPGARQPGTPGRFSKAVPIPAPNIRRRGPVPIPGGPKPAGRRSRTTRPRKNVKPLGGAQLSASAPASARNEYFVKQRK